MNAIDAVAVPAVPSQEIGLQSTSTVANVSSTQPVQIGLGKGQGSVSSAKVSGDSVEISKTAQHLNAPAKPASTDPFPDLKIPAVEKLIEKIKNNGFPYESTFYKAMHRIAASDAN
ncbi:MAG: hypothetical protein MUF22_04655 [Chitinispirillaceae bacterium]|jgi:hypothetical protein|nr:hypothetical protein [Chitinispirillaceae bacterium]